MGGGELSVPPILGRITPPFVVSATPEWSPGVPVLLFPRLSRNTWFGYVPGAHNLCMVSFSRGNLDISGLVPGNYSRHDPLGLLLLVLF